MKPSHWLLIASLYVTQFLPVSFFFMGLPAILRSEGKSLEQLGALYLLGFVWVLKIVWAPAVDRLSFGWLGHYRGWIIVMQSAMVLTLLVIAQVDGPKDFTLLIGLSLVLTVFSATQDIATDALTCRLLPASHRGLGNSLQVGGGLIGIMLGAGATLALYNSIGWSGCLVSMAAVLSVSLVQVMFFREPALQDLHRQKARRVAYSRIWRFWMQPGTGRWMPVLLILPVGIGMIFAMLGPMLIDIGWSMEAVGFTLNVVGSLAGLAAVFATGWLIKRYGRRRMLTVAAFAQFLVIAAVIPIASGVTALWLVVPGILATFLIYNPIATIMLTVMMDRAETGSEGTDFTAQYSLYSFMGFVSGAAALQLAAVAGYVWLAVAAASLSFVAGLLTLWLYREPPSAVMNAALRA